MPVADFRYSRTDTGAMKVTKVGTPRHTNAAIACVIRTPIHVVGGVSFA
jgi:hypothetical protein